MIVTIKKIVKGNVFCSDYNNLSQNNTIDFTDKNVAIVYGSNGTGKTSFALTCKQEKGSSYCVLINNAEYTQTDSKVFHVISDQHGRNIIEGSAQDFLLGENIKREYELKREIDEGFNALYNNVLIPTLKDRFGISAKSSPLLDFIKEKEIKNYISDLANVKQKGAGINREEFLSTLNKYKLIEQSEFNEESLVFFISDNNSKDSVIKILKALDINNIKNEPQFEKVEETEDAIKILEKYVNLKDCLICDTQIEREKQLEKKKTQNKSVIASLSEQAIKIVEKIINKINNVDPFLIKPKLKQALIDGNNKEILGILVEIEKYECIYNSLLMNMLINALNESNLTSKYVEYSNIINEKPEFEDEDLLFIENFLNECLDREIHLSRDSNKNLQLLLGNLEFLNQKRETLMLSNGEQNFLSLAFELLKAKNASQDIIILDDPISSFDSIYKNKIAFAILKILGKKKSIVLTHNTELIKLLEHQHKNSFNLYYMNNTEDEVNGFIPVNTKEIKYLLYIHEFLNLLRSEILDEIIDERSFLISLVPFMRGYCQILNEIDMKNQLTSIMHGYKSESINLTQIYNSIFAEHIIKNEHVVSAQDIICSDVENLSIIKNERLPLLSRTLIHTYTYLFLRLNVEKALVDLYGINVNKVQMLSDIILAAFKGTDKKNIKNRTFLLSRKTLLNEFNHFEMDMNIFQPAIDITNHKLKKEKEEIISKIEELKQQGKMAAATC